MRVFELFALVFESEKQKERRIQKMIKVKKHSFIYKKKRLIMWSITTENATYYAPYVEGVRLIYPVFEIDKNKHAVFLTKEKALNYKFNHVVNGKVKKHYE